MKHVTKESVRTCLLQILTTAEWNLKQWCVVFRFRCALPVIFAPIGAWATKLHEQSTQVEIMQVPKRGNETNPIKERSRVIQLNSSEIRT